MNPKLEAILDRLKQDFESRKGKFQIDISPDAQKEVTTHDLQEIDRANEERR